jgi:protoporphyrinogen oxidase
MPNNLQIIIGGGPTGLTAGYIFSQKNVPVLILEADSEYLGGISKTIQINGNRYDIGSHRFFSKSQIINDLWDELLPESEWLIVNRLTRIHYKNKYYDYPLKPLNAFKNIGGFQAILVLYSYFLRKTKPLRPENSFSDWVRNRFGDKLFIMFFKSYTEKVWGITTDELSADWAAQRIQNLSLSRAILNAIPVIRDIDKPKTLIEKFRYPRLGAGQVWQNTGELIKQLGGQINLNSKVQKIYYNQKGAFQLDVMVGSEIKLISIPKSLISTLPINYLIQILDPPPSNEVLIAATSLKYRAFISVLLVLNKPDIFKDNWIYIHDTEVLMGRIQNFRNWSLDLLKYPNSTTTIGVEYFCTENDEFWKYSDTDLIKFAEQEIRKINLIDPNCHVLEGNVARISKAYPIYDDKYKENILIIRNWLENNLPNVVLAGRNGLHKYNNQDHSMLAGLYAASNILGETNIDLWKLHSEDSYDEEYTKK